MGLAEGYGSLDVNQRLFLIFFESLFLSNRLRGVRKGDQGSNDMWRWQGGGLINISYVKC